MTPLFAFVAAVCCLSALQEPVADQNQSVQRSLARDVRGFVSREDGGRASGLHIEVLWDAGGAVGRVVGRSELDGSFAISLPAESKLLEGCLVAVNVRNGDEATPLVFSGAVPAATDGVVLRVVAPVRVEAHLGDDGLSRDLSARFSFVDDVFEGGTVVCKNVRPIAGLAVAETRSRIPGARLSVDVRGQGGIWSRNVTMADWQPSKLVRIDAGLGRRRLVVSVQSKSATQGDLIYGVIGERLNGFAADKLPQGGRTTLTLDPQRGVAFASNRRGSWSYADFDTTDGDAEIQIGLKSADECGSIEVKTSMIDGSPAQGCPIFAVPYRDGYRYDALGRLNGPVLTGLGGSVRVPISDPAERLAIFALSPDMGRSPIAIVSPSALAKPLSLPLGPAPVDVRLDIVAGDAPTESLLWGPILLWIVSGDGSVQGQASYTAIRSLRLPCGQYHITASLPTGDLMGSADIIAERQSDRVFTVVLRHAKRVTGRVLVDGHAVGGVDVSLGRDPAQGRAPWERAVTKQNGGFEIRCNPNPFKGSSRDQGWVVVHHNGLSAPHRVKWSGLFGTVEDVSLAGSCPQDGRDK